MRRFLLPAVFLLVFLLGSETLLLTAQPRSYTQTAAARAQRDSLCWEQVLQSYQSFCRDAVAAKAGDEEAAGRMRGQADSIGVLLKAVQGSRMTASQQARFDQMKQVYSSVVSIPFPENSPVQTPMQPPVQIVTGQTTIIRDTVVVIREVQRTDTVRVVEQVERIVEVPVEKVVEVTVPVDSPVGTEPKPAGSHFITMTQVVVPDLSYGAFFGMVRQAGIYVRFDSNFRFQSADYRCTSDGQAAYGQIWTTGRSVRSRLSASGGALWHPLPWLTGYAGAGYGVRGLYWEDLSGCWAQVTDASCRGVAADLGLIFNIDHFCLSAGVTTIAFRRLDCVVGVGLFF